MALDSVLDFFITAIAVLTLALSDKGGFSVDLREAAMAYGINTVSSATGRVSG